MGAQFKADLDSMAIWAEGIMASRPPDVMIGEGYLQRWWVLPRNDFCNVYLHYFTGSDIDRALHDHLWPSTSVLLAGSYDEITPEGRFTRQPGDVTSRAADAPHRLEMNCAGSAASLFITGPKVREWGFLCEHGWVHWRDFTHPDDPSQIGAGCGEGDDLSPVTPAGKLPFAALSDDPDLEIVEA